MAITKNTSVERVEVRPAVDASVDAGNNAAHETLMVVYHDVFDDSDDDQLPVTHTRVKHIERFVEDGGAATDYSEEDALVQTLAAAVWTS